jgi:AraC-like DNA-binding protein
MANSAHETHAQLSDVETLAQRALYRSPAVQIYDVRCRPRDFSRGPEECLDAHQIAFPRHGVFERETRGERAIVDLNQVLFFNAHEPYRIAHPAGCGDDCTVFVFDPALLHEAVRATDPARADAGLAPFRFAQTLSSPRAFLAQEAIRSSALRADPDALAIEETSLRLLHALVASSYSSRDVTNKAARRTTEQAHQTTVRNACFVLGQRFREELSLEQLARAVYSSPFHLARLFKQHVGVSIHQYRTRLRLREALRAIGDGEQNLARLALELGFTSHSHLTDSFRAAFGAAPSNYRKLTGSRAQRELSRILEVPAPRG